MQNKIEMSMPNQVDSLLIAKYYNYGVAQEIERQITQLFNRLRTCVPKYITLMILHVG